MEKPRWGRRWLIIRLTLLWCAMMASWIIVLGADDRVRETALIAVTGLAASVVCGHLGFASWNDRAYMRTLSGRSPNKGPEE